jgi:hypothetical protein
MSLDHPNLVVVPFRMLPSEMDLDASAKKVDEERRFIRDTILKRTQQELSKDSEACALMRQIGSDLAVNSFACNFRVDGVINQDVSEANALNSRIYDRLSHKKMTENLESRKVIIMSSVLSQKKYGACLSKFKERLGLRGQEDLVILVNVSMSPFVSPSNFEHVLADAFREVAEQEVEVWSHPVLAVVFKFNSSRFPLRVTDLCLPKEHLFYRAAAPSAWSTYLVLVWLVSVSSAF